MPICLKKNHIMIAAVLSAYAAALSVAPAIASAQAANAISYQDILDDPANYALTLDYAQQQAGGDNLVSAASALERLLFVQPDWHSVRLFYAAVLYRLDDKQGAQRELDLLETQELTPSQQSRFDSYKSAMAMTPRQYARAKTPGAQDGAQTANLDGRIELGLAYDDNAGNSLADNTLFTGDQDDSSLILRGRLRGSAPLGDAGISAAGVLYGQSRRYQEISDVDYDVVGAEAGLRATYGEWQFGGALQARQIYLSGQTYLTETGPKITVARTLGQDAVVTATAGFMDQDFDDLSPLTQDSQRSGDTSSFDLRFDKNITPTTYASLTLGFGDKSAHNELYAYDAVKAGGLINYTWPSQSYIRGQANFRALDYAVGDREESRFNGEVALGAPVSALFNGALDNRASRYISIEVAAKYTQRDFTNFSATDYDNTGVELRFIADF